MKLDKLDVEALASSRVNRVEGRKTMWWFIMVVIALMVGMWILKYSAIAGYIIWAVGIISFLAYYQTFNKKVNAYKATLFSEWEAEKKNGG